MSWARAAAGCAAVLVLGVGACDISGTPIEGQWSGRAADGSYVGYTFGPHGRGERVVHDTVTDFTYAIDEGFDPPRILLAGNGTAERGVVRFVSYGQMRLRLAGAGSAAPVSFTPANPGVVLTRREVR